MARESSVSYNRARAVWPARLSSAFRTVLACAIVGSTTLYGPPALRAQLAFPAFSYVTAILIVSDAALGDTLRGGWHALCATAQVVPASVLILWLVGPENVSASMAAVAAAVGAFLVALPEFTHLMCKRIAFGQIVIVCVGTVIHRAQKGVIMHPVQVALSTGLGVLASVLALLLPYPRLAYFEDILELIKIRVAQWVMVRVGEELFTIHDFMDDIVAVRKLKLEKRMSNAHDQERKLSQLYAENASERISLFIKAFTAQDTTTAFEALTQAKPLAETAAKLLHSIKLLQEGMSWERPQIRLLKPPFMNPPDWMQVIEIPIRGMEIALTSCPSFPVSFMDKKLSEVLLGLEVQIGFKLEQTKCSLPFEAETAPEAEGELLNKFIDSLRTINPNIKEQTALFFLFCVKLLQDNLDVTRNPRPNNEESRDSLGEAKCGFKSICSSWLMRPKKETLVFAIKCALSLGFAVFFGLIFNKENGYWSGLTIAISFAAERQATFTVANTRGQGTAIGSVYGVLGCFFFRTCDEAKVLALLPWIIFTSFLRHSRMYGQAGGISAVIGALLILGRKDYGFPAEFAIARLTEAFIGLFCFITVELLLQPTSAATLAKAQLAQTLGTLCAFTRELGFSSNQEDLPFVFQTLREKQEKLKIGVNKLKKSSGEAELEPNFWFLPFRIACYNKLLKSITKMVDLLLFMSCRMEFLAEASQRCRLDWGELGEQINNDLELFKENVVSSLDYLEKISSIKSLADFERETQSKKIHDDLELGKSQNADACRMRTEIEDAKILSSFLEHSKEVNDKIWAQEGEDRSKSQMTLCLSAIGFCISGLMRETKEIENGVKELVQWENPSCQIKFHEISRKINALYPTE